MPITNLYATKLIDNQTGDSITVEELVSGGGVYTLPAATTTVLGGVKKAATQADFAGADIAALKVELNAFLAKLKTAGIAS